MEVGWFYSWSQIKRYFSTRVSSLVPARGQRLSNPLTILKQLNRHQWLMFSVGFLAWMWDAFGQQRLTFGS